MTKRAISARPYSTEFKGGRRSHALRAAFDALDKDGTESLDGSEVSRQVVALMDAKDDTSEVFQWIDEDGNKVGCCKLEPRVESAWFQNYNTIQ